MANNRPTLNEPAVSFSFYSEEERSGAKFVLPLRVICLGTSQLQHGQRHGLQISQYIHIEGCFVGSHMIFRPAHILDDSRNKPLSITS
jgi:hypothetical protein